MQDFKVSLSPTLQQRRLEICTITVRGYDLNSEALVQ